MFRRVAAGILLFLVAACSADSTSLSNSYTVALAIDSIALRAGDSVEPTVRVTVDGVPRVANSREIIVSSSDTGVVTVGTGGTLMAVGRGSATITVRWMAASSVSSSQVVNVMSEDLTGVILTAPSAILPRDTAAFVVVGKIAGGRIVANPVSVSEISRNPAVAITTGGQVIGVAPGSAWIVVTASTGVADSSLVTVAVGSPAHMTIAPHSATITAGFSILTSVTLTDRRNNAVVAATTYSSSAPTIATVQADGTVSGVAAGSALIVATSGLASDTLRLVVMAAPALLTRLVATPDSITLNPGGSTTIQVQAVDALGAPMTLPALAWQSQTPGITVSSGGVIQVSASITTAIPNGAVQVSSGSISATVRVAVVIPPPVLAQLVVSPDSVTLNPGTTATIAVHALDTHGAAMALPPLAWQSQTSGISVTSGVIQASSTIVATIPNGVVLVSSGSVTATVRVAVVVLPPSPPPPSDGGYVQIRWVGTLPAPAIVAAFEAARLRLNGLFNSFGTVPPQLVTVPAGLCMAGTPVMNETIPGIVLYAQVTAIDGVGNILGSAGPCLVRDTTWIPVVGAMQFDVADMSSMVANGTLNGVVLHEMMHTLGFGTIWGPVYQDEVPALNGADPRYIGPNGVAGYAAVGGTDTSGVPVENTGGSGTRGSHWRESVFHTELMTGWADGAMQMSKATVGALKDFGYDVNMNLADPFTLGGSISGAGLRASQLIVEATSTPIGVVGGDGKISPYGGPVVH